MITDLKPYAEYKDSGVPWLGEIPKHWEVRRLKHVFKRIIGGSTPASGNPRYWNGNIMWVTPADVSRSEHISKSLRQISAAGLESCSIEMVPKDSIILTSRAPVGNVALAEVDLCTNQGCKALIPDATIVEPKFAFSLISVMKAEIQSLASGTTFAEVSTSRLGSAVGILPPPAEQAAIVRILDWANGRLERAIRAKRKVIALLNEQKQAIIHRAVTRGLDPSVPLKDSGVPWLGEIPEHWEVRQLRRLVKPGRRITYGIVQPGEPDANGRFMVRGQDYSRGWANRSDIFRVSAAVEIPYSRSRLAGGDLVLTIVGAGVGNVAVVPEWLDGANITQTTARVSVDPLKADATFVALVLQGPIGRRNVERYVKGAAQPGLNLEHVRVFLLPMPPLVEQQSIVHSTRAQLLEFDNATTRLEREITLLREYRTRLVADVVTGKLDVRAAAAALPDEAPLDDATASPDDDALDTDPDDLTESESDA